MNKKFIIIISLFYCFNLIHAEDPLLGDLTNELEAIANPLQEYNMPVIQREYRDLVWYNDKLYFAYGTSRSGFKKYILSYDPSTNQIIDEDPGNRYLVEEWARFIPYENDLYLGQSDPQGGFPDVDVFNGDDDTWSSQQIQIIGNDDRLQHIRDFAIYDNQIFAMGGHTLGTPFPEIISAPLDQINQNFTKNIHTITNYPETQLSGSLGSELFLFKDKLYAHLTWAPNKNGERPYLVYYDKDYANLGWQEARESVIGLFPESSYQNLTNIYDSFRIETTLEVPKNQNDTQLILSATDNSTFRNALYVIDSLLTGEATRINLPYGNAFNNSIDLIYDNNTVYALSTSGASSREQNAKLFQCRDLNNITSSDAWDFVFEINKIGLSKGTKEKNSFQIKDGVFYIGESSGATSTTSAPNPETAGTLWSIDFGSLLPQENNQDYQVGSLEWTNNDNSWQQKALDQSLSEPIVILGAIQNKGPDPCVSRVMNVQNNQFEYKVSEWDYLYPQIHHANERIDFIALEAGRHVIKGLNAESGSINVNHNYFYFTFNEPFDEAPVIFTQVVSNKGKSTVTTRIRNISAHGFELKLQEQESGANKAGDATGNLFHRMEDVHFLAIDKGLANDGSFKVGISHQINQEFSPIRFGKSFDNPKVIMDMQTAYGNDTAALRYKNLSNRNVQVFVEEEQSKDEETSHIYESVGWIVFEY